MSSVNAQVYSSRRGKRSAMAQVQVTVEQIRLFVNDEFANVDITFPEEIEGYVEKDNGFILDKTNHISMKRAAFTADCCECSDLVADYRSCRETGFDQKALSLIFRGATLVIERTSHKSGEEVLDRNGEVVKDESDNPVLYQRDCFTSQIKAVKLTKRAIERIENALVL